MKTISWKRCVGQSRIKDVLASAVSRGNLGHAYLLCGLRGYGTIAAACDLAEALLCEQTENAPCGTCPACARFQSHDHPDFHLVHPLALQKEHKSSDGSLHERGWEYLRAICREVIEHPYRSPAFDRRPTLPVEWIREMNHAVIRGPVASERNIVIISDIDVMLKESANALLKTLEEPPDGTLIICTTERPQAVLPTIVSRCQVMRLGVLEPAQIREGVSRYVRGTKPGEEQMHLVVEHAHGSLQRALQLCDTSLADEIAMVDELLGSVRTRDWTVMGDYAEALSSRLDYGTLTQLILTFVHVMRERFFTNATGSQTYITEEAGQTPQDRLDRLQRLVMHSEEALRAIRSYCTLSSIIVIFLMNVSETLYGKEQ